MERKQSMLRWNLSQDLRRTRNYTPSVGAVSYGMLRKREPPLLDMVSIKIVAAYSGLIALMTVILTEKFRYKASPFMEKKREKIP